MYDCDENIRVKGSSVGSFSNFTHALHSSGTKLRGKLLTTWHPLFNKIASYCGENEKCCKIWHRFKIEQFRLSNVTRRHFGAIERRHIPRRDLKKKKTFEKKTNENGDSILKHIAIGVTFCFFFLYKY